MLRGVDVSVDGGGTTTGGIDEDAMLDEGPKETNGTDVLAVDELRGC